MAPQASNGCPSKDYKVSKIGLSVRLNIIIEIDNDYVDHVGIIYSSMGDHGGMTLWNEIINNTGSTRIVYLL